MARAASRITSWKACVVSVSTGETRSASGTPRTSNDRTKYVFSSAVIIARNRASRRRLEKESALAIAAYAAVDNIHFEGAHVRRDIAAKAV